MRYKYYAILLWMFFYINHHAQVPEHLYYKFNDSASVFNFASDPQGNQNIPVPPNLFIDTTGFQNSNSLADTSGPAMGGVQTGYHPDYSKSFTISFWYKNTNTYSSTECIYLFGDSLAGYHCMAQVYPGGSGSVGIYGQGGLDFNIALLSQPAIGTMIHVVYDATPTQTAPYGTYTMYANGFSLIGAIPVTTSPYNVSSGISIGSAPASLESFNSACPDTKEDMEGNMDEFRWYDHALSGTEILNTYNQDLLPKGNCSLFSHFKIDSITNQTAKVTWAPGSGSTSYFLEYGTAGFTKGMGNLLTGNYPAAQPSVLITGLVPETSYDLYFGEICNSGTDSIYNSNPITFTTRADCPTPVNIIAEAIGTDSAFVDWDAYGPVQKHYITYGISGFDPAVSGITDTVQALPHKIGGLLPGSRYDIYIKSGCGMVYGNSITIKRSIATNCSIKTAPYFESFEDSTWVGKLALGDDDTINLCWNRQEDAFSVPKWAVFGSNTARSRVPFNGHNASQKFLGSPSSFSFPGQKYFINSPWIDIANLAQPYLSFYYHRYYSENFNNNYPQPDLIVEVNDGTGWVEALKLTGESQLDLNDPYTEAGVPLTGFGDTIQVRFVSIGVRDGIHSVNGIDDIRINEAPVCPDVFDISSLIFNPDTSVVLDIHSYSNSWDLGWQVKGFSQATACISTSSTPPYTISNCIAVNSNIDIYVKDCQSTTWQWLGPFEVCGPYSAPYFTDFQDGNAQARRAECWETYSTGKGSSGDLTGLRNDSSYAFSGTHAMRFFNMQTEPDDTLMAISPGFIDLPEGDKQIRFMATVPTFNSGGKADLIIGTIGDPKLGNTFSPVDTVSLTTGWKEHIVQFDLGPGSHYNGVDTRIVLMAGNGIEQVFIDDFYYETVPACPAPLKGTLGVKERWFDGVWATWQSYSGASTEVKWGIPGFNPDSANFIGRQTSTGNTYRISGLLPNTSYEFFVRDSCGSNDQSSWVGPYEFTTLCAPLIAPYLENFDGAGWGSAPLLVPGPFGPADNTLNIEDTLGPCWSRNKVPGLITNSGLGDFYHTWGIVSESVYKQSGATQTGPVQDYSGTGNYVFPIPEARRNIGDNVPDTADLYSPLIDVSSLSRPYLSFYYHRYTDNNYMPGVDVQVNEGNGWYTVDSLTGISQVTTASPFIQRGVELNLQKDTIRIRFRSYYVGALSGNGAIANYEDGVSAIDEIEINEVPPCLAPQPATVSYQIDTATHKWSTLIYWYSSNDNENDFQVVIGKPGQDPDSLAANGGGISTANDSLIVDTLMPGCYDIFIRATCNSADTSQFSSPAGFCVPCTPLMAPYYQSFDLITPIPESIPVCWNRMFNGNSPEISYSWLADTASILKLTGPSGDFYGQGQYMYLEGKGNTGDRAELYSPMIDITTLNKPEVYFAYHMFGAGIDTLHMDVFDGYTWYNDVVTLDGQQQFSQNAPWKDTIVKLDPFNNTGLIQVRFRSVKTGGGRAAIDNFQLRDTVTCPLPGKFRLRYSTDSTVVLTWDSDTNAIDFSIEYGVRGFSPGTGTVISTAADSVVIPITDNRIYSAYLRVNCGSGDSSMALGPLEFSSGIVPCDDIEVYGLGPVKGQSTFIRSWSPGPGEYYKYQGQEQVSAVTANSGSQSVRLSEDTIFQNESSFLANFEEISTGKHALSFAFNATSGGGGSYRFISGLSKYGGILQPAGVPSGTGGGANFYINHANQTLDLLDLQFNLLAQTPLKTGWNEVTHIIDFQNDTAWIILNEKNTNTGWHYTDPTEPYLRVQGVHFRTTPANVKPANQVSEYYIDDICVAPFACPAPDSLLVISSGCTQAVIGWKPGIEGDDIIIEYGLTGFLPGTGTTRSVSSDIDTLTGLSLGGVYDVYLMEMCGNDTTRIGPVILPLATEAVADFSFNLGSPTPLDLTVNFDGSISKGADSLFWDFGDGTTGTGVSPSHTYTANGSYTVQLIVTSVDCGADTLTKTVVITGIGLPENPLDRDLSIYPNPAKDALTVEFSGDGSSGTNVRVLDISGKLMYLKKWDDTHTKYLLNIDLSRWAAGIYVVEVRSGGMSVHRRISKQ